MSYRSDLYDRFSTYVSPIFSREGEWDPQLHIHTCEELLFFPMPGTCTVVNNGTTVTVTTPAFIWNRAGSYHNILQVTDKGDGMLATFNPHVISDVPEHMLHMDFLEDSSLFVLPLNFRTCERLQALFNALLGSPYFQRQMLISCICHQITQGLAAGLEPQRSSNAYSYIFKVIKLLQSDTSDRLTVDHLAERFHVGKTKLKADFKKITDMPIHTFRLQQQLQSARAQIARTDAPLAQIASDCGFTDESHLIRAFRSAYGVTPGAFRRKYMGNLKSNEKAVFPSR